MTQLLDCEAYQLRNAAVVIMANIVVHVLADKEEVEDADSRLRYEEQKTSIIKMIMQRSRDKSAFARAKTLHMLSELVEKNLINQALHLDCLLIACNRIKDVASNVRRKAMQLLWKEILIFARVILKGDTFLTRPELLAAIATNARALETLDKPAEEGKESKAPAAGQKEEQPLRAKETTNIEEGKEEEARLKLRALAEYYGLYEKFLTQIENIVPSLIQLLGSKNVSDVIESIKLLTVLCKHNVPSTLVFLAA